MRGVGSKARILGVGLMVMAIIQLAPAAVANDADVIREGNCSGASDWKLKLSPENGRLEVEFEVDQNVVGDTWRIRMLDQGEVFFTGRRTTQAPSGSFEVETVTTNRAGDDNVVARAVNLTTGEVCRGKATATF